MKNPPAFQFYAADFLIGVMGMTDEEIGIYMRMLCTQWIHGSLPNCPKTIKKLVNSSKKPSEIVLKKFEICDDGMLRNARMEIVREKQQKFAESRQNNANERWKKDASADASALQVHSTRTCKTDALQSSSPTSLVLSKDNTLSDAEEIYAIYPLKAGRKKAIEAIRKALKKASKETLLESVTAFAAARNGVKEFTPHPSTWFNEERWLDDRETWKPRSNASTGVRQPSTHATRSGHNDNEHIEIPF